MYVITCTRFPRVIYNIRIHYGHGYAIFAFCHILATALNSLAEQQRFTVGYDYKRNVLNAAGIRISAALKIKENRFQAY